MESASKKRGAVPDAAADLQFFEPAPPTPATATKRARRAAAPPAVSSVAPPPRLGHALPFITVVDGKFTVQPAALEALARMPGPLAVIAVAGKYRTGKSYLLNNVILGASDHPSGDSSSGGFSVGPSIQPCTKGLWLYSEPIACTDEGGAPIQALVVDTEGIGATGGADETHDSRIFALAMLLASCFIYNSRGVIDEDALAGMSLVVNVSKSVAAAGGAGVSTEVMPAFLWVVRDFALQLVSESGAPLSEAAYLEEALRSRPGAAGSAADKNAIRDTIKQYFPRRDCVTLVRPTEREEDLQCLSDAVLRPRFKEQVAALRQRVLGRAPLKRGCGGMLASGRVIGELAAAYADAINRGAAPLIRDTWALVSGAHCAEAAAAAAASFRAKLLVTPPTLPGGPEVAAAARALARDALRDYDAAAVGERAQPVRAELQAQLDQIEQAAAADAGARIAAAAEADAAAIEAAIPGAPSAAAVFASHRHSFAKRASPGALAAWDAAQAARVWAWAAAAARDLEARCASLRAEAAEGAMQLQAERYAREKDAETIRTLQLGSEALAAAAAEAAAVAMTHAAVLEGRCALGEARNARLEEDMRTLREEHVHLVQGAEHGGAQAAEAAEGLRLALADAEAALTGARAEAARIQDECAELEAQYREDAAALRADMMRAVEQLQAKRREDAEAAAKQLAAAATGATAAREDAAAAEAKAVAAGERAAAVVAALRTEMEASKREARDAVKAAAAEALRIQEDWRRDVRDKHAAHQEVVEQHAAARLQWQERAAGYEGKLRLAEGQAQEAAAARAAAAEATVRARGAEAEARSLTTEAARVGAEIKHAREAKMAAERRAAELHAQVCALERKLKESERTRDVELLKVQMAYEARSK
jgi:hypothetical protein